MNLGDRLAAVPLFSDLDRVDLDRLAAGATEITVPAGDALFDEGDAGEDAYVITAGEIEILKKSTGRDVLLAVRTDGDVIGEMSLLEEAPRMAGARARTDVTAIVIPRNGFEELLDTSHTAARAMFGVLLARWRETEARLRQSERMAQLGTLTAGMAHELNNPSSAVNRAARSLGEAVDELTEARAAFGTELPDALAALLSTINDVEQHPHLGAIARSDAETEVEAWLESHGATEPWNLAPALVSVGVDSSRLGALDLDADDLQRAIRLLVAAAAASDLIHQITEGSGRVFEIVQALKSYSFLDRAPVQEVDLHRGLDDTLLILRSKIGDITVERDYGDLPIIPAYGSELNQVWTNLISNAVDAIEEAGGAGTITIRTRTLGDLVAVEVEDDGPGIPAEILPRIFDSFFTTKEPGKGTGLGLDISYGIVVHRHGGEINVVSEPGKTLFTVTIPVGGPPG